ncbi:inorganic phosphate transporter [Natrialbaceae archaeon GCM10025810]|uniref:inorganic phosphate transporter n=1 Tax=Halovalidus salilacus TaxID=3075124 RepID=UPI00360E86E6
MTSVVLLVVAFAIAFFVSMVVGASSVSVSMAPAVGAGSVNVLRGAFFVGIFGFLGAVLQGASVATGVSDRIVSGGVSFEMGLVSLFVIGLFIALGIVAEHSIPAAFSTFGSVAGTGIAAGQEPRLAYWYLVFAAWIATGVVAALLGYVLALTVQRLLERRDVSPTRMDSIIVGIGIVFSFVGGGSQVGLAIGPLVGVSESLGIGLYPLLAFGGLGILVGAWVVSSVMLNAVGRHYASLGQDTSIAVLATAVPMVQVVANVLGVPISYNHIIINSIAGCGRATGSGVDLDKLAFTIASWIATLVGSFAVGYGIYAALA